MVVGRGKTGVVVGYTGEFPIDAVFGKSGGDCNPVANNCVPKHRKIENELEEQRCCTSQSKSIRRFRVTKLKQKRQT